MESIAKEDMPLLIIWITINIIATYYWYIFVFKGGAEKIAEKPFIFRGTIMPRMPAKKLKIVATLAYLFLILSNIVLFF